MCVAFRRAAIAALQDKRDANASDCFQLFSNRQSQLCTSKRSEAAAACTRQSRSVQSMRTCWWNMGLNPLVYAPLGPL